MSKFNEIFARLFRRPELAINRACKGVMGPPREVYDLLTHGDIRKLLSGLAKNEDEFFDIVTRILISLNRRIEDLSSKIGQLEIDLPQGSQRGSLKRQGTFAFLPFLFASISLIIAVAAYLR